jgi:hypothetical protein
MHLYVKPAFNFTIHVIAVNIQLARRRVSPSPSTAAYSLNESTVHDRCHAPRSISYAGDRCTVEWNSLNGVSLLKHSFRRNAHFGGGPCWLYLPPTRAAQSPQRQPSDRMRNAFDLTGQRILITGAAEGIGAAAAHVCAALGAETLLVDAKSSETVAASILQMEGRVQVMKTDASSRSAVEQLASEAGRISALVLNAAICPWDENWQSKEMGRQLPSRHGSQCSRAYSRRARLSSWNDPTSQRPDCAGGFARRSDGGLIAGPLSAARPNLKRLPGRLPCVPRPQVTSAEQCST